MEGSEMFISADSNIYLNVQTVMEENHKIKDRFKSEQLRVNKSNKMLFIN